MSTFPLFGNSFGAASTSVMNVFPDVHIVSFTRIAMIPSVPSFPLLYMKRESVLVTVMVVNSLR